MHNRTPIILGVIAATGLATGATIALWRAGEQSAVASSAAVQPPIASSQAYTPGSAPEYNPVRALVAAYQTRLNTPATDKRLTLRMDEALTTAAPEDDSVSANDTQAQTTQRETPAGKAARAEDQPLKIQEPLNLRIPEVVEPDEISRELAERNEQEETNDSEADAETFEPKGLALQSAKVPATPKVTSYSLFNPEYGLRGFMKQGWVNSSLGFQGGLGFNDGRRIQTEDDSLRDDIAVGMGVILAF